MDYFVCLAVAHAHIPSILRQYAPARTVWNKRRLQSGLWHLFWAFLQKRMRNCPICAVIKHTIVLHKYQMEEITRILLHIYRNYHLLLIELSGWMGSVTYGLGADWSLPPFLSVTTGIWTLAHKSDLRAEISGSIVRYDALAPRPEVLLPWFFVCACAFSLEPRSYHMYGKNCQCLAELIPSLWSCA